MHRPNTNNSYVNIHTYMCCTIYSIAILIQANSTFVYCKYGILYILAVRCTPAVLRVCFQSLINLSAVYPYSQCLLDYNSLNSNNS